MVIWLTRSLTTKARRTRRTESAVQDAFHPISKNLHIEIDEKAQPKILKSQVSQELCLVDVVNALNGFHFDNDAALYEQIQFNTAL